MILKSNKSNKSVNIIVNISRYLLNKISALLLGIVPMRQDAIPHSDVRRGLF